MGTRPLGRQAADAGRATAVDRRLQDLGSARFAERARESRGLQLRRWQRWLLVSAALPALFGVAASFSTTVFLNVALDRPAYGDFYKHLVFLLLGCLLAAVAYVFMVRFAPARRWLRIVIPLVFYLSLALVALVLVPGLGKEVNGARRFLDLGFVQFQPSELLKVSIVLYLGQLLCWWRKPASWADRDSAARALGGGGGAAGARAPRGARANPLTAALRLPTIRRNGRPRWPELPKRCAVIIAAAFGLTVIQPDLGSAAIILGCSFITLALAGVRWRQVLAFAALLVVAGALVLGALWLFRPQRVAYVPYRLSTWAASVVSAAPDEDNTSYQLTQSRGALAVGGLTGRGFLHSDQKMNRLPFSTNDFVFPVMVEELGYLGGLLIILLFLNLAWAGVRLACCCRDPFSRTVIAALGFTLCFQGFVNIAVTIGTLPLSGLTLPFFSAGGTSLVVSIVAVGLMYALAADERRGLSFSAGA